MSLLKGRIGAIEIMEDNSQLERMITRALADGILSREESDAIKTKIYADKKVTPEEAKMFRLLQEKIWQGEVAIDY